MTRAAPLSPVPLPLGGAPAPALPTYSIRAKLYTAFGLMLVLLVIVGLVGERNLARVNTLSTRVYTQGVQGSRDITDLRASVNELDLTLTRLLLGSRDPAAFTVIAADRQRVERLLTRLERQTDGAPDAVQVQALSAAWDAFDARYAVLLSAARSGTVGVSADYFSQLAPLKVSVLDAVRRVLDLRGEAAAASRQQVERAYAGARLVSLILGALALVLGAALAYSLARGIVDPARQVARAAALMSRGETDVPLTYQGRDELGQMVAAFREMVEQQRALTVVALAVAEGRHDVAFAPRSEADDLGRAVQAMVARGQELSAAARAIADGDLTVEIVPRGEQDATAGGMRRMREQLRELTNQLVRVSREVSAASSELVTATSQQATGVNQQSAAITETTAAVDEVRSSSEEAVTIAERVSVQAERAREVAQRGVEATEQARGGMQAIDARVGAIAEHMLRLSQQSQQIGEIVASVSDIADQSNLLALNAAIEASRAGEQGRGFVVIAQEIRALAEQSKGATAQIRSILGEVQGATNAAVLATEEGSKQVQVGGALIQQAGETIADLAQVNREAALMSVQIAEAVRQHAISMEQISLAMNDINNATVQNMSATGHSQDVARTLSSLVAELQGLLGRTRT